MKYYFILAAAGVGKRMGLGYPKQFLEYKGKPLFISTLQRAEGNNKITDIIVVTNKNYIEKVKDLIKEYKIKKIIKVVAGGKERQDSIFNGLKIIEKCSSQNSLVAIQDGVRPFLKDRYIDKAYEILNKKSEISGVVVGVKVKDTIKKVSGDIVESTPKRENLIAVQTPQVFRQDIILKAYKKAKKDNFLGTDDSSLVENIGGKVKIIEGSYGNIKVTTPEDLDKLKK
ncbi:MAG: 2-C-methyl-D-erythritol 4-phosphate cytidylyltransferase [Fusobacteriota bacterium]